MESIENTKSFPGLGVCSLQNFPCVQSEFDFNDFQSAILGITPSKWIFTCSVRLVIHLQFSDIERLISNSQATISLFQNSGPKTQARCR